MTQTNDDKLVDTKMLLDMPREKLIDICIKKARECYVKKEEVKVDLDYRKILRQKELEFEAWKEQICREIDERAEHIIKVFPNEQGTIRLQELKIAKKIIRGD